MIEADAALAVPFPLLVRTGAEVCDSSDVLCAGVFCFMQNRRP